jgi:hypothetical protein
MNIWCLFCLLLFILDNGNEEFLTLNWILFLVEGI